MVDGDGTVKLGDFGAVVAPFWMRFYYGPQTVGFVGTLVYMAPELWLLKLTPEQMADF